MTSNKPSVRTQQEQDSKEWSKYAGREGEGARDKIYFLPGRLTQEET